MSDKVPMREVSDAVVEAGGEDLLKCFQCGTCTAVCPWNLKARLRTREVIHLLQLGLEGFEDDDLWRCVTCHACVDRCPREVGIAKVIESARSLLVASGTYPRSLSAAVGSLTAAGNPWQGDPASRRAWASGLSIDIFDPARHDVLLFVCCTPAFDPRTKATARAAITLLKAAGVSVGLLPAESEVCCGDLAVRVGATDQAGVLSHRLGPALAKATGKPVVVLSPHCRETLRKNYDPPIEAVHIVELLDGLLGQGRLRLTKRTDRTVTFHDPCYLGRRGGVYDAPRRLLEAVPGLKLVEMSRHHAASLCCGGGGGGAWSETAKEERLANQRMDQALATNASIVATACPFCLLMLQDAAIVKGIEDKMRIMDVIEIMAEAL